MEAVRRAMQQSSEHESPGRAPRHQPEDGRQVGNRSVTGAELGAGSGGSCGCLFGAPVPGQQLGKAIVRLIGDAGEDIPQIWDIVEEAADRAFARIKGPFGPVREGLPSISSEFDGSARHIRVTVPPPCAPYGSKETNGRQSSSENEIFALRR